MPNPSGSNPPRINFSLAEFKPPEWLDFEPLALTQPTNSDPWINARLGRTLDLAKSLSPCYACHSPAPVLPRHIPHILFYYTAAFGLDLGLARFLYLSLITRRLLSVVLFLFSCLDYRWSKVSSVLGSGLYGSTSPVLVFSTHALGVL